jgi:signal transduction histidine kinase
MHTAEPASRTTTDKTRQRMLAYELHDGLCQLLAAGIGYLNAYRDFQSESPDKADEWFELGVQVLNEAMDEARQFVGRLTGTAVQPANLIDAVRRMICTSHWSDRLSVKFDHDVPAGVLSADQQNAAFRIIQESLTNVACHSRSTEAQVNLVADDRLLRIQIEDGGVGFDLKNVPSNRYGIEGMQARATALGGRLAIESAGGCGTRVVAEIPLTERDHGQANR